MTGGGSLANLKRIGVRLHEGPIAEGWDKIEQLLDHRCNRRGCHARDLGFTRTFTSVASQPGERTDTFAEDTTALARKTNVTIVHRVG